MISTSSINTAAILAGHCTTLEMYASMGLLHYDAWITDEVHCKKTVLF